jgi:hypothetical protein
LANKANVTLYLETDLVAGAKQCGINLSGLVEYQLKQTLANIQSLNGQGNIDQNSHNNPTLPESPLHNLSMPELLDRFEKFCLVDLQLSETTVSKRRGHIYQVTRFLKRIEKRPEQVTVDDIRNYLFMLFKNKSPYTYANVLKSFRVFFRDDATWLLQEYEFQKRESTVG